jgi:uncharacterized membrane protein
MHIFNYYRLEQISISTFYIMLHHVTLHVTLKLLYFTIVLDIVYFFKGSVKCCNL